MDFNCFLQCSLLVPHLMSMWVTSKCSGVSSSSWWINAVLSLPPNGLFLDRLYNFSVILSYSKLNNTFYIWLPNFKPQCLCLCCAPHSWKMDSVTETAAQKPLSWVLSSGNPRVTNPSFCKTEAWRS